MLPLFAVGDVVWVAIIGVLVMILKELFDRQRGNLAAKEVDVDNVRKTLEVTSDITDGKLEDIKKTGEMTYHLSNSAMQEQKRLLAVTARAKADISKDPVDMAAADVAEEAYNTHKRKQDQLTSTEVK